MNNLLDAIADSLHGNDKGKAVAIHNHYLRTAKARSALLFLLANSLSPIRALPDGTRQSVIADLSKNRLVPEGLSATDAAMEAISLYRKDVNDAISVEDTPPMISKESLDYYIGSRKDLSNPPAETVLRSALEHIIDGRASGVTGREYFNQATAGHVIDPSIRAMFDGVFDQEEEIVDALDLDLIAEGLEEFFVKDQSALDKVKKAKIVRTPEFKNMIKEGDVVIVARKSGKDLISKVFGYANTMITGSSFSSAKLVGPECKTIVGYGVRIGVMRIRDMSIATFLKTCNIALVLRHSQVTDDKRKELMNNIQKIMKQDPEYSMKSILMTIFKHGSKSQHVWTKKEARKKATAMICTSFLTKVYRASGVDPKINVADNLVWPIDFIRSPAFEPVTMYVAPHIKIK